MGKFSNLKFSGALVSFVAVVSIISCLSYIPKNKENHALPLFEYLESSLAGSAGMFLLGDKIDFFILRRPAQKRIDVFYASKKIMFLPDGEETIGYHVSRNGVFAGGARCKVGPGFTVFCDPILKNKKLLDHQIDELLKMLHAGKDIGIHLTLSGQEV